MLKARVNKTCHFYDFNSGILVLNRTQEKVSIPELKLGLSNTLISVKKWALSHGLINDDDKVMLC